MDDVLKVVIGAAPVLGGLILGIVLMNYLKPPDIRSAIKADLDLVDRLPADQAERRAQLQQSINLRVDDVVAGVHRSRAMRDAAMSYRANWRDVMVFVSTVLFTYIWWTVDHARTDWLSTFLVLIVLSAFAFGHAAHGAVRAIRTYVRDQRDTHPGG